MNAAPVSASTAAASGARSAGARTDNASAESGFAALFAQLEPTLPQAEPTVLPSPAAQLQAEGDEPEGPDPALLAVLGLAPLPPSSLPVAATGLGLPHDGCATDPSLTPTDGADVTLEERTNERSARTPWEQTALNLASLRSSTAAMAAGATTGDATAHAIDDGALAQRTIAEGALSGLSAVASGSAAVAANTAATEAARAARAAATQRSDALNPPSSRGSPLTAELALAAATPAASAPRPAADFSTAASGAPTQIGFSLVAADPNSTGDNVDSDALLSGLARADRVLSTQRGDAGASSTALQASVGAERAELASTLRESLMPMAPVLPGARLEPGSPQFSAALGQQMLWMASQQVGRAELKLAPDELGPLDISLEMNGDEVRAEFASRSAEVRSLLESQVPRLREMLAEHGFSLADAQIGQERAAYQDATQQREGFGSGQARVDEAEAENSTPAPVLVRARQGLVDDYA